MGERVSVVLVAIGGYGRGYADALLHGKHQQPAKIAGVVDPFAARSALLPEFERLGVPIVNTLDEFYAQASADLAVIASPIQYHCPQTVGACEHGSNVLCEKPLCATVQEAQRMLAARDRAGKWVGIGYQWSYSDAIQSLKRDIQAGVLGAPRRFRTIALMPRDEKYYRRASWPGRIRDDAGNWVLDSPVNNACAHDLHNMLYVLGERTENSARPAAVVAELYRANDIENYDTAALRVWTDAGVELLFITSHAVERQYGPVFEYEFEDALVVYGAGGLMARFHDGRTQAYVSPDGPHLRKLWAAVSAVTTGAPAVCGIEAAMSQTICMNGAQDAAGQIVQFPEALVSVEGEPGSRRTWVRGLADELTKCYEAWQLPSEYGSGWSRSGRRLNLRDYQHFPGGKREQA